MVLKCSNSEVTCSIPARDMNVVRVFCLILCVETLKWSEWNPNSESCRVFELTFYDGNQISEIFMSKVRLGALENMICIWLFFFSSA
jgi:hypothetical protein